ncbi:MAG: hypothetical protein LUO89_05085 [Methanothrix sp.]|nr:hypothetical protein [Methanothrix sp.]
MNQTTLTNEAQVVEALRQAIAYAENFCNRKFVVHQPSAPAEHCWNFSGQGGMKLFTPQGPIQTVDAIEYWNGTEFEAVDSDTYTDYIGGPDRDYIAFREQYRWVKGQDNWRVTYTYGYDSLPADLKRALLMIAQAFTKISTRSPDIKSQSDGEQTFTYSDAQVSNIAPDAEAILMRYRRLF